MTVAGRRPCFQSWFERDATNNHVASFHLAQAVYHCAVCSNYWCGENIKMVEV